MTAMEVVLCIFSLIIVAGLMYGWVNYLENKAHLNGYDQGYDEGYEDGHEDGQSEQLKKV